MWLSAARVAPLSGTADLDPDTLRDLLWRDRDAVPGIEHIRVRAGPGWLDIAVFSQAPNQADAEQATRQLIQRTLSTHPNLRLWRLV